MITVTDTAKKELDAYFNGNTPASIRVFMASGWGGPRLALALDEAKTTDLTADEQGYHFCMDKQLLAEVDHVTINFNYMGFSVEPAKPFANTGSACGSCSSGGSCSPAQ